MPERILIIEDDPDIAMFERTFLERAGYEIKVAHTGAAGLETEPQFKPAIVLLDVELPDISGLDVCTSLANSSDAFILMVSAHSSEGDKLKGLGLGADDYIAKPFSGNELVARVQSFLRRREVPLALVSGRSRWETDDPRADSRARVERRLRRADARRRRARRRAAQEIARGRRQSRNLQCPRDRVSARLEVRLR